MRVLRVITVRNARRDRAAAAPGCQESSDVTLDIAITRARCGQDVKNTAITVGVKPHETETTLEPVGGTLGDPTAPDRSRRVVPGRAVRRGRDCPGGSVCSRKGSGAPGKCLGVTTCINGTLYSNGQACDLTRGRCTTAASPTPICSSQCATDPTCCTDTNCSLRNGTCPVPPAGGSTSLCDSSMPPPVGPPSCDGSGNLTCAGALCNTPNLCCVPAAGGAAICSNSPTGCPAGYTQHCCTNAPANQCFGATTCSACLPPAPVPPRPTPPSHGGAGTLSACQ